MTEFKGYRCWEPQVVTDTIATEAAAPSDAVLLATHTPLSIRRQPHFGATTGVTDVDEHKLVREFLETPAKDGVLIASVLGESGSGKSHLIRWVEANIEKRPGRHVVPLRRIDTSLRDVVEALLMGRDDPQFTEIRQQLNRLGEAVDPAKMARSLVDNLAEALLTAETHDRFEKSLVGEKGLQLLLHDPVFRSHILRDGGFVQRRIDHALHGRDADAPDVPLQFTVDDLPLDITQSISLKTAAAPTQAVFSRLSTTPEIQQAAVALMNEYLDVAVMKAANLDVGNLQRAFMRVRQQLVGDEIILLIEDVALIQGVRRDLLDAIIEVGVVRGKNEYATVRTMLAVTPAYYMEKLPETFRTRSEASSPVYVVDVDVDARVGDDSAVFVDFLGRYLNAARVGREELERSHGSEPPNACAGCDFVVPCHDAFGKTSNGFGLYPYNRPAALAAVKASSSPEHPTRFNPRRVLHRAVKQVLTVHSGDLQTGEFPGPGFRSEFNVGALPRLPLGVRADLDGRFDAEERERYETFLEFWGEAGALPIKDVVWSAFSLEPIEIDPDALPPRPPAGGDDQPRGDGEALPVALARHLEAVDAWSKGDTLKQAVSGELRALIRDAVVARVAWATPPMKEPTNAVLEKALPRNARIVAIEGAHQGLMLTEPPVVDLPRTPKVAKFFTELLLAQAGIGNQLGALLELDRLADEHAERAQARVVSYLKTSDTELVAVAASLLRGAALLGILPPNATHHDSVTAVLASPSEPSRADSLLRVKAWVDNEKPYASERLAVVRTFREAVGVAQGTGEIHAVDRLRLDRLVRDARRAIEEGRQLALPDWAVKAEAKLAILEATAPPQQTRWQQLITDVRMLVPTGESYVDTVDALTVAVRDGVVPGLIMVPDIPTLTSTLADARTLDFGSIAALERIQARLPDASGLDRLSLLGSDVGSDAAKIADFLSSASDWVDAGLAIAISKGGESVADLDADISEIVTAWREVAERLTDGNK